MSDNGSETRSHHQPAKVEPEIVSPSTLSSEFTLEPASELTSELQSEPTPEHVVESILGRSETQLNEHIHSPLWSISDLIHPETTCVHMGASGQRAAIHELVGLLIKEIPEADPNRLVDLFEMRERFCSTTVFDGVALPFVEIPQIESPVVALATSLEGVEFNGPDRAPTHLFVAIATPEHKPELITRIFARLTRLFRDYSNLAQILSTLDDPKLLRDRFTECERRLS